MTEQLTARDHVHVERDYQTTAADLWEAITTPDRLSRWIATVRGDLSLGGTFEAEFTSGWSGPGVVASCQPPERLLVRMAPGTDDATTIEATISTSGDRVRLVVEERGYPEADVPAHLAGWTIHLEDLATDLAGGTPLPWEPRWRAAMASAGS